MRLDLELKREGDTLRGSQPRAEHQEIGLLSDQTAIDSMVLLESKIFLVFFKRIIVVLTNYGTCIACSHRVHP